MDTNILVYHHREDSPFHAAAAGVMEALAASGAPWAIAWPSVHEFLSIVTHPRIYRPPTPLETALASMEALMECPALRLIGEGPGYWKTLAASLRQGATIGPRVHDARIAAICLQQGVTELWSVDRDFSRFPALRVVNPLIKAS